MDALEAHLAEKAKARRTRNALDRAKAKAYRNAKTVFPYPESYLAKSWEDLLAERESYVLSHYRNRQRCSCSRCGNPRHHRDNKNTDALSLQERVSLASHREQMDELDCE